MDRRIQELLPWFANNTLSESERAEVQAHLDRDSELRHALAFYEEVKQTLRANPAEIPASLTPGVVLSRIDSGISERITAYLRRLFGDPWLPRLAYGLGAVIIAQAAIIAYLAGERSDDYTETRSPAKVAPISGPFIRVSFKPDATEAEIRFLLTGVGASFVGGPTQLGDYFLYLNAKRTDAVAQQLRQSPIVDAVSVIATLPQAKE